MGFQSQRDRQGFLSHPTLMLHFGSSYKSLLSQLPVKRIHCFLLPWQRSPEPVARWGQGQVGWVLSSGGREGGLSGQLPNLNLNLSW